MQPRSVLIIGCGLIGTSIAMAIQNSHQDIAVDGVEVSRQHRDDALPLGVYRQVYEAVPEGSYDVSILAIPVEAACGIMEEVAKHSKLVMDVCSVKQPVCERAIELGLQNQFAPTHPMAGNAGKGPLASSASLFAGQPWILIDGWPAARQLSAWIETLSARIEWVRTPLEHDRAMAAVSHGIHLMSVAAMLSADREQSLQEGAAWNQLTGPGFRDVTRLSQSPHGFWVSTLLSNRTAVAAYLKNARLVLFELEQALQTGDERTIADILCTAKQAKEEWGNGI